MVPMLDEHLECRHLRLLMPGLCGTCSMLDALDLPFRPRNESSQIVLLFPCPDPDQFFPIVDRDPDTIPISAN